MNQNKYRSILFSWFSPMTDYSRKCLKLSTNSLIVGARDLSSIYSLAGTHAWWKHINQNLYIMSFCLRSKVIHDLLSCWAFLSEFTGKLIKIPTNFIEQAQAKNVSWKLDNYELKWTLQLIISIPFRLPKLYWKPINCLQIPQSLTGLRYEMQALVMERSEIINMKLKGFLLFACSCSYFSRPNWQIWDVHVISHENKTKKNNNTHAVVRYFFTKMKINL